MKKLCLIIFVFLCAGCQSSYDKVMSLQYYKDESTQICFAGRAINTHNAVLTWVENFSTSDAWF